MPQPPEKGSTEPNRAFLAHLQQMFGYLHESQKKFYDTRELCGSWRDYEHLPINPSIQMDVDEFYNMLFEQLESVATLVDRGWHETEEDQRTVSHLMCDQVEFSNLILVNKCDLVSKEQRGQIEAFLRKVNPKAELAFTEHSKIDPALLLDKAQGRFSLQRAAEHPQWLAEAREGEHTPETIEYGISSFIFRAKRPFHPERLHTALGSRPPSRCSSLSHAIMRSACARWSPAAGSTSAFACSRLASM